MKCEVCGKPANYVVASPLGAISEAKCDECSANGISTWSTLVGGLYGTTRDTVAEWLTITIKATCAHYGKTEDELWADVEQLDRDYEAYLKAERK